MMGGSGMRSDGPGPARPAPRLPGLGPDAVAAGTFRSELRKHLQHGKPLAVTEFGCCAYTGAGDRGGMGWEPKLAFAALAAAGHAT